MNQEYWVELLTKIKNGDSALITELREQYYLLVKSALLSYKNSKVRIDATEISDLVQDGITKVFQNIDYIRSIDTIGGYLNTIAENRCAEYYRYRTAQRRDVRNETHDSAVLLGCENDSSTPSKKMIRAEMMDIIRSVLATCKNEDRIVFCAHNEGNTWEMVRLESGDPTPEAARQRYYRVIEKIRNRLNEM